MMSVPLVTVKASPGHPNSVTRRVAVEVSGTVSSNSLNSGGKSVSSKAMAEYCPAFRRVAASAEASSNPRIIAAPPSTRECKFLWRWTGLILKPAS